MEASFQTTQCQSEAACGRQTTVPDSRDELDRHMVLGIDRILRPWLESGGGTAG